MSNVFRWVLGFIGQIGVICILSAIVLVVAVGLVEDVSTASDHERIGFLFILVGGLVAVIVARFNRPLRLLLDRIRLRRPNRN